MQKRKIMIVGCIWLYVMGFVLLQNVNACAAQQTVAKMQQDIRVMPDLYNTGAKEPASGFYVVENGEVPCTINGENGILQGNVDATTYALNFEYKQKEMNGTYIFENIDFSKYTFRAYALSALKKTNRSISFVFNNCKFKTYTGDRQSYEEFDVVFNDCTFISASGSDITFNRCRFGGGIHDRMNLFVNCYVNDCYIYNPTSLESASGEIHVDGVQIYGTQGIPTENIHFDNCRFEVPAAVYPNAQKTYVNACIMLQTEYSDGNNMSFKNCYLNGGGYSMYVHGVKGTKISNIVLENLHFGSASLFGNLAPDKPEHDHVTWNEDTWDNADSIYVGTVQRDDVKKETYLSVSNDTSQKRYFRAYTSSGKYYDYEIEACLVDRNYKENAVLFEDLPFDQQYVIPEYCDWVVVYDMEPTDNSTQSKMRQVRFQNWTDQESVTIADVSAVNMEYNLLEDGTMTVTGFGNMPTFTSKEQIPWYSNREKIKAVKLDGFLSVSKGVFEDCSNLEQVVVNEKLTTIEDLAFANCGKLSDINLSDATGLKSIGENTFLNCVALDAITFPASLKSVGKDAFAIDTTKYTDFRNNMNLYYEGSLLQWTKISFGNGKSNPMYMTGGYLYVDGRDKKLVEEVNPKQLGIQKIGIASFAGCVSLKDFSFEDVEEIGNYAFAKTSIRGEITVPKSIKKIGSYAFNECKGIEKVNWQSDADVSMGCFQNIDSLVCVQITGDVKMLGNWCFSGCPQMGKVVLPKTLTSIRQKAFYQCDALSNVFFMGKTCPEMTMTDIFVKKSTKEASIKVYIPEGADGYLEHDNIKKMATHLFEMKIVEQNKCIAPAKEQCICLLHKECEENHEEIGELGEHTPGKAIKENEVAATAHKEGSYEEVVYCSVCKVELRREKKVIAKLVAGNKNENKGKIILKKTAIKKIVNKKKRSMKLTWKKRAGVTGYEIQYCTKKSFKKKVHTKKVKKASKTTITIKGLKKNKKYYVRIRTYKIVDGTKYVSKWSTKKNVTIVR